MTEEFDPSSAHLSPKLLHAFDLISALCEDQIATKQLRELESLVLGDPEICRFYVEIMQIQSMLSQPDESSSMSEPMAVVALPPIIGAR